MFTALIVAATAIVGGASGVAFSNIRISSHQKQAHVQAAHYLQQVEDQLHEKSLHLREHAKVVNHQYRMNVNKELDNQTHDNEALSQRLHNQEVFLRQNEDRLAKLKQFYQKHVENLTTIKQANQKLADQAQHMVSLRHQKLNEISQISDDQAKSTVLDQDRLELKREKDIDVKSSVEEMEDLAEQKANDIIIDAIQRGPLDQPRNHIERSINIPDKQTKKRLLARDQQFLRLIETVTGTDLIFDDEDPLLLHIVTHDAIRRETARRTLSNLIVSRHLTNSNVEIQVRQAEREVDGELRSIGEKVVQDMHLGWMHPDLMKILGRLKFRTSYGQNVLYHCMEVGAMCGVMAAELGMNARIARRAGVLHDIGKSIDHEVLGTHVELGVKLAKTYHEDPIVINAIAAHHQDVEAKSPIALLVRTADALSGARPGARSESVEEYIQRLKNLEAIANQQDGVRESYAIQAGRELRIIVNPKDLDDQQSAKLTDHVRDRIQNELSYPGKIKITTIRKLQAVQYVGDYHHRRYNKHERQEA